MKLGQEAAELISAKFVKPIKLEFEKVRQDNLGPDLTSNVTVN